MGIAKEGIIINPINIKILQQTTVQTTNIQIRIQDLEIIILLFPKFDIGIYKTKKIT